MCTSVPILDKNSFKQGFSSNYGINTNMYICYFLSLEQKNPPLAILLVGESRPYFINYTPTTVPSGTIVPWETFTLDLIVTLLPILQLSRMLA